MTRRVITKPAPRVLTNRTTTKPPIRTKTIIKRVPVRRVQTRRTIVTTRRVVPVTRPATRNLVEPLVRGPRLSQNLAQVQAQFGAPRLVLGNSRFFNGFGLNTSGPQNGIVLFKIGEENNGRSSSPVRLRCGLGIGSSRSQVTRLFGRLGANDAVIHRQYNLDWDFKNNQVVAVTIKPYRRPFFSP